MSNLKSTWTETSYDIKDPDGVTRKYYWQAATMEKDPIDCLLRNCGMSHGSKREPLELKQYDEDHYSCVQYPNRFGEKTFIELRFDCQDNPFPLRDNQTIYDHRERDLQWEREKLAAHEQSVTRPGFKKMPMTLNFGGKK